MRSLYLLLALSFQLAQANAQSQTPCSSPGSDQFDFWIGEWDLFWKDSIRGTNKVEKLWGNCVVQENFKDPATGYSGKSWTVYNPNLKRWQQTWVDSQGGYIVLTGIKSGDSITLSTEEQMVPENISPTKKRMSRMVYHHITPVSFDWRWESSTDSGKTWNTNWLIHYKRKR